METVSVQGVEVPELGLGTWQLTGQDCRRAVETALDVGYRHVDTAQAYDNERAVGDGLANSSVDRDDVWLTTKVNPVHADYEGVLRTTRESLARLGTDYVDLLLLHWPNPLVDFAETARAFDELVDEGLARHVGVSNFGVDRFRKARDLVDHDLLTNQVLMHPYHPQRELVAYCQETDASVTAYSPLAHGGLIDDERLADIGRKYDATAAQVAIRWVTQIKNAMVVPKASSREHIEANAAVYDFTLSEEELERINRPSLLETSKLWIESQML